MFCDRNVLVNFKIGLLSFGDHLHETETLDRTAECLAERLEVTTYALNMDYNGNATRAILPSALQHEAVRSTILDLTIEAWGNSTGAHVLTLLTFRMENRAGAAWAGDVIQNFIVAEDTSRVPAVISVVKYIKRDDPLDNNLPAVCSVPRKRGVDAPDTRFIRALRKLVPTKSDLYVFVNATSGKELHVHAFKAKGRVWHVYGDYAILAMTTA